MNRHYNAVNVNNNRLTRFMTTNIKISGLGGMGVISCANILGTALFKNGYDVKKSEVHGMSQRGGSLCSDVRFGERVFSPMIPIGEVDYHIALADEWKHLHEHEMRATGKVLSASILDVSELPTKKALNVAMVGVMSHFLDIAESAWVSCLTEIFAEKLHEGNEIAFQYGRSRAQQLFTA